jgi:predicted nucleic acid-binding Zn ribbon protein
MHFKSLGEALSGFLTHQGLHERMKAADAIRIWPEVVGVEISSRTKPVKYEKGRLFIKVNDSEWRNELIFLERKIKDDLNAKIGLKLIKGIVFR